MPDLHFLQLQEVVRFARENSFQLRDLGLLDSSLARPMSTLAHEDAYPTLTRKASALFSSLLRSMPLISRNKRFAWLLTSVFLQNNGLKLICSAQVAENFILDQLSKQEDLDEIEAFFVAHLVEY